MKYTRLKGWICQEYGSLKQDLHLNFLARALYKRKETLMITAEASNCRNISESPRGSKYLSTLNINGEASVYRTGATRPYQISKFLLSVIQYIPFYTLQCEPRQANYTQILSFYATWKPTALLHKYVLSHKQYTVLHPLNILISYCFYVVNSPVISWAECTLNSVVFGSWGDSVSVCHKYAKFQPIFMQIVLIDNKCTFQLYQKDPGME